jgi:glycosyltransferase involved in cell wall biosynthesis
MKKVLIISYYWPPSGGSGVQRWVKFAKYLPAEGWKPVVYTPSNPELIAVDKSLLEEIPGEVEVIKRKIVEPYAIYRRLFGGNALGSSAGTEVNPISGRQKNFKRKLSLFIRGNFFIPDPRCLWVRPSVRFLKRYLEKHPVDVIVSTGPPHSMHLIGLKLSKKTGLPWVADFRDPWTKMFYFKHLELTKWSEKRHRALERKVLDGATAVVAVSPKVREDFQAMTSTPVELITNGYDESDYRETFIADENFNVTHTGLFAADGNPETFWKVLADKCSQDRVFSEALRIRLVGKTDAEIVDSIRSAGLGEKLMNFGYKDHLTAVREQRNATVLLLPLRQEPEYEAVLPGKLFEYLASRRPILGIGQPDSAMAAIVAATHAGKVFDWDDADAIRIYVDECWDQFKSDTLRDNEEDISRFDRKTLTKTYVKLLERML